MKKSNANCGRCHTGQIAIDDDIAACLDCGSYRSSEFRPGTMLPRVSAAAIPAFNGIRGHDPIPHFSLSQLPEPITLSAE